MTSFLLWTALFTFVSGIISFLADREWSVWLLIAFGCVFVAFVFGGDGTIGMSYE